VARRGVSTRVGKRRSVKTWIGTADQGNVGVGSAAKVLLASFTVGGLGTSGTVIRSRGILNVVPQVFTADLNWDGAFGMAIVSETAALLGITAIPGPFSDDDWTGWFVHQYFAGLVDAGGATDQTLGRQFQYEIDSKAMRKVSGNESIVLVAESRNGALNVKSHVRVLFLES